MLYLVAIICTLITYYSDLIARSTGKTEYFSLIFMDLERFCKEDFIYIPEDEWCKILAYIGDDKARRLEVTTKLAELSGRYPLPIPEITEEEALKDYVRFTNTKIESLSIDTEVRGGPYKWPVSTESWKWNWNGVRAADRFFQPIQLQASHRRYRSPAAAWGDVGGRRTAFNALVALKKHHVDKKMVLTGFRLRLHIAGNFMPTVAREIYDRYGGDTVLDFSAGYGGRLVGFWGSSARRYIGIDPNTATFPRYSDLGLWLESRFPKDKTYEFLCKPAEEVDYSPYKADLVFTSPPYFNLERYSQEDTQSWKRYKTIDSWKSNFLFQTLERLAPCVNAGGHIIINICDSPSHDELRICDDMCNFVQGLGFEVLPALKMLMTNRPGNKTKPGACRITEPIWVFRKN